MTIKTLQRLVVLPCLFLAASLLFIPYPGVQTVAQVSKIPVNVAPPKAAAEYHKTVAIITQASKKDSLDFVKAAKENDHYQDLLIQKVKKQSAEINQKDAEIAALKKQNLLLKKAKFITVVKKSVPMSDRDTIVYMAINPTDTAYIPALSNKPIAAPKKKITLWRRVFGKKD